MMLLADHIANAYHSLRRNRSRTLLTILGITIGVASITSILVISAGVRQMINAPLQSFDGRLLVVKPEVKSPSVSMLTKPLAEQSYATSPLMSSDVALIRAVPGVDAVAPVMIVDGLLKYNDSVAEGGIIVATTPDFVKLAGVSLVSGQFLDDDLQSSSVVVGQQLAIELFGTDQAVGQLLTVHGSPLTVVGVAQSDDRSVNYNGVDLNQAVMVNFDKGLAFHGGQAQIQQIDVLANSAVAVPGLVPTISDKLYKSHQVDDFTVLTGSQIADNSNQFFSGMSAILTAIAAISLVVGGVGVMNIMLVGVAERIREVGVRKAIGASSGMIAMQFLTESALLSLLGGVLGVALGYAAAFGLSIFLGFSLVLSWQSIVIGVGVAVGVGVLFGLYPALRASRKNVIEALRQYH